MVSTFGSRSSNLGSSPAGDIVLCSWARHFTFIVPLSTQVYKFLMLRAKRGDGGGGDGPEFHPGEVEIPIIV